VTTTVTASIHLDTDPQPPYAALLDVAGRPAAYVHIADLSIYGRNPAHLHLLAEALTDAARQLSDELDRIAAAQVNKAQAAQHYSGLAEQAATL
jgi:hypothetical protein